VALLLVWAQGVHRGRHLGYTQRGAGAGPPNEKIAFSDSSNIRLFVFRRVRASVSTGLVTTFAAPWDIQICMGSVRLPWVSTPTKCSTL
jgi:hypothetical protein